VTVASQETMAKAVHMPLRTFKRAMAAVRGRYVTSIRQKTGANNHTILCIPPDAEVRARQGPLHLPLAKDKRQRQLQQKAREIAIEKLLAACSPVSSNLAPARANMLAPQIPLTLPLNLPPSLRARLASRQTNRRKGLGEKESQKEKNLHRLPLKLL
jgi:hypothetical protein